MKLISAHINDLQALYVANLQKALDLEQQLVDKGLPGMIEHAADSHLEAAFKTHLEETRGHAARVEALLQKHTGEASAEPCKVIRALITEAEDTIKDVTNPPVLDVALIGAAQQVEHHEIAVYGTLRRWAEVLGYDDDVATLKAIEAEEGNADKLLSELAQQINLEPAMA